MKREIKFRAWDGEKMYYSGQQNTFLIRSTGSWSLGDPDYDWTIRGAHSHSDKLMQYTGLKDKNGKEIYEGDILQKLETDWIEWANRDYEGTEPLMTTRKDVATMDRFPRFWLKNESFGYEGEDLEDPDNWEIIGNIYENPELLK